MPANSEPIFTLTPKIGAGQVSAANTNLDGSGTIVSILTGGSFGTRIHRITVHATVTTTAGMVRLYIDDGVNVRLWKEVVITAITVAASTAAFDYQLELFGERALILPSGYELQASTHNAESINVIVEGADF